LYKSPKLFEEVDALIIDECHTATAGSYEEIISPSAMNTIFRTGYTGTLPKNMVDKMTMLSVIGSHKKYITPRQLIEMGLATEVQIKCLYFNYPLSDRTALKGLKYPEEVEFITNHPNRNRKIAQIASKISKDGNTIVLFDRVEHGEQMAIQTVKKKFNADVDKKLLQKIDNPYKVFLVTGNTKASVREQIRQLMEQEDDVIMFGTSSILSTGVNIKRLKHLVLTSGGKSSIKINQSIGRLLRLHVSKAITTIWDIVDDLTIKKRTSTHKNYL
jgi:superfamily II DNA or RNA helicase